MPHWGDGVDNTDNARIWAPGDPEPEEEKNEFDETVDDVGPVENDNEDKTEDTEKTSEGDEVSADTGMEPVGSETPSPEGELKENTNVETKEVEEAIKEAPKDAPNGPQTLNLDKVDEKALPPINKPTS